MSQHPLATPGDPNGYRNTVVAVRNLFKRQALTLETAWSILLQRESDFGPMPADAREPTTELLLEFGYAEHLVTPVSGEGQRRLWLRPDWDIETIDEAPLY